MYRPTSPTTTSAVPSCTGKSYTIQSGDTCQKISESQGIGTDWLLSDNSLKAYCHDFPTSGTLCLSNTCRTYTVKANDTCSAIASANNITTAQLRSWNPSINVGCNNIETWIGYQICIEKPGSPFVSATASFSAVTSASVAISIPTNVAEGTNTKCARYYSPVQGDYCNLVILKFGISLPDFLVLNPEINAKYVAKIYNTTVLTTVLITDLILTVAPIYMQTKRKYRNSPFVNCS